MSVKVKMVPNWESNILAELKVGLVSMVTDIHKKSVILAPKDTRAMVNDSKIEPIADGYKVVYGSSRTPYARKQHYEHQTNSGYLADAGDNVARSNLKKYFEVK